jgi:hypothetical protein
MYHGLTDDRVRVRAMPHAHAQHAGGVFLSFAENAALREKLRELEQRVDELEVDKADLTEKLRERTGNTKTEQPTVQGDATGDERQPVRPPASTPLVGEDTQPAQGGILQAMGNLWGASPFARRSNPSPPAAGFMRNRSGSFKRSIINVSQRRVPTPTRAQTRARTQRPHSRARSTRALLRLTLCVLAASRVPGRHRTQGFPRGCPRERLRGRRRRHREPLTDFAPRSLGRSLGCCFQEHPLVELCRETGRAHGDHSARVCSAQSEHVHVTRVLCAVISPLSHCARDGCVSIGLTQRLCVSTEASGTHARSGAHGAAEFVS